MGKRSSVPFATILVIKDAILVTVSAGHAYARLGIQDTLDPTTAMLVVCCTTQLPPEENPTGIYAKDGEDLLEPSSCGTACKRV